MNFCGDLFQIEREKTTLFLACVRDKDHQEFHHSAVLDQGDGKLVRIYWGDRERWEQEKVQETRMRAE